MFFKKKKNEHWEQLLKIVELMKVGFVELSKEVDMIKERLKSPLVKKNLNQQSQQEETQEEKSSIDDGFDAIRSLRKDLNMGFS